MATRIKSRDPHNLKRQHTLWLYDDEWERLTTGAQLAGTNVSLLVGHMARNDLVLPGDKTASVRKRVRNNTRQEIDLD